jgi:hypothetical protein
MPVSVRRVVVTVGVLAALAVLSVGAVAQTQTQPPQQPAGALQPDPFNFNIDTVLLFFPVKEAATADFEFVMTTLKDVLSKSEKPDRKAQANTFQVFKIEGAQGGNVTYAMLIDPVSKGLTYDFGKILSEGMPPDKVQEVFTKLTGALGGQVSTAPLKKVITKDGGSN